MKTIIRRSFITLLSLASIGFAKPEIINQNVIKQSAYDKISEISSELHSKTGVSISAHFLESANNGILEYEKNITSSLQKPYVFLVFAAKEQKVDIVVSDELREVIKKEDMLSPFPGGPIIPILASTDKNDIESKFSAAALNGVADIADKIALDKGITLASSIGSESRSAAQSLRIIFYGAMFFAFVIYFYQRYKRRRAS